MSFNSDTPVKNIKNMIMPYLKEAERAELQDVTFNATIKASNSSILEFDFKNKDQTRLTIGEKDIIIGVYHQLKWKKSLTGEWKNSVSGILGTNPGLGGMYNGLITTTAGRKPMVTDLLAAPLEDVNNHQGSIEAGKRDRFIGQVFVWQGNNKLTSQIRLDDDYGTTISVEEADGTITAANQIYVSYGFKGIFIGNFGYEIGAKNWADFNTFYATLKRRGAQV